VAFFPTPLKLEGFPLPFLQKGLENAPATAVLARIQELVRQHYSMPRRDITDFFFQKTVKEMKKMLRDPLKQDMERDPYLSQHLEMSGKIEYLVIDYFHTGVWHYAKYSLPRHIAIRHLVKQLFPVVLDRMRMVPTTSVEVVVRTVDPVVEDKKELLIKEVFKQSKLWVFGIRYRFGSKMQLTTHVYRHSVHREIVDVRDKDVQIFETRFVQKRNNEEETCRQRKRDKAWRAIQRMYPAQCMQCRAIQIICTHVPQPHDQSYYWSDEDEAEPIGIRKLEGINFEKTIYCESRPNSSYIFSESSVV